MGNVSGPGHRFDPHLAPHPAEPATDAGSEPAAAPVLRAPVVRRPAVNVPIGRLPVGRPQIGVPPATPTSATERIPAAPGGGWDTAWIFAHLRQHDDNADTRFDGMRCVAASTLSGVMARG